MTPLYADEVGPSSEYRRMPGPTGHGVTEVALRA